MISEKTYEGATSGVAWRKLLFGLCLFNSVIHERKKYGALGWNIAYEFNDSDLEVRFFLFEFLYAHLKNGGISLKTEVLCVTLIGRQWAAGTVSSF